MKGNCFVRTHHAVGICLGWLMCATLFPSHKAPSSGPTPSTLPASPLGSAHQDAALQPHHPGLHDLGHLLPAGLTQAIPSTRTPFPSSSLPGQLLSGLCFALLLLVEALWPRCLDWGPSAVFSYNTLVFLFYAPIVTAVHLVL